MTVPAKALFVPTGAPLDRVQIEPRQITTAGHVTAWGVRSRPVIDLYRRRGQITQRQHDAAARFYQDWSLGVVGAREPREQAGDPSGPGWEQVRLDHLTRYRRAMQHLGQRLAPVVCAVALEDQTIDRLSREWSIDRRGLVAVLRVGLDQVGDFYRLP